MIISHSKKFIFVHIAKTGGMTLTRSFKPFLEKGDIVISSPYVEIIKRPRVSEYLNKIRYGEFPYNLIHKKIFKSIMLEKHSTSLEIKNALGYDKWKNYYKFCFVRNPYDRCVSAFFWIKKNKGEGIKNRVFKDIVKKISSFSDFNSFIKSVEFEQIRHINQENFLKPMVDYVYNDNNKLMVDYIGKLENYSEELNKVKLKFDFNFRHEMNYNQSYRKKNYRSYYTEDTRKIVEMAYKRDIEEFEYKF